MGAKPTLSFGLDRLSTPIGMALLVTDATGVLRALDWEEHEPRMRELLRLQYGALDLKDARAPRELSSALTAYFKAWSDEIGRDITEDIWPGDELYYKLGDDWIRQASLIARRVGYEAVLDTKPETFPASFPMSQIALYLLIASIPFEYPERSIPLEIPTLTGAVFLLATLLLPRRCYGREEHDGQQRNRDAFHDEAPSTGGICRRTCLLDNRVSERFVTLVKNHPSADTTRRIG